MVKLLLIDNYDSFTYNIVHYLGILNYQIDVIKNDSFLLKSLEFLDYTHIILSPGPGSPLDSGLTMEVIKNIHKKIPILGVCLGHQCLGNFFGGRVVAAKQVMHGKASIMCHDETALFTGLPKQFKVIRYHSLVIDPDSISADLKITGWTTDTQGNMDAIMAIQHQYYPIFGVQYHPEAILTEYGLEIFQNFIDLRVRSSQGEK